LVANRSTLARGLAAEGLWDAEAEDLLAAARRQLASFLEYRATRACGTPYPAAENSHSTTRLSPCQAKCLVVCGFLPIELKGGGRVYLQTVIRLEPGTRSRIAAARHQRRRG